MALPEYPIMGVEDYLVLDQHSKDEGTKFNNN